MLEFYPTHLVVYLTCLFAVLGLVMGSALNCLALRLAEGKKWSGKERSECPHCHHILTPGELIPLVSWLVQKGKCRHCGAKISPRYPITETVLAAAYAACFLQFGLSLRLISVLVFVSCLFCLSLVDLDTQIIPDRFILIPLATRIVELLVTEGFQGLSALIPGLIIGGGVLVLSLIMDKVLKKDTMGGGDIKLLFLCGCFLALPECLLMVMIACILGIAMASILLKVDSETAFPFGPAISVAAVITLFIGNPVMNWYMSLF